MIQLKGFLFHKTNIWIDCHTIKAVPKCFEEMWGIYWFCWYSGFKESQFIIADLFPYMEKLDRLNGMMASLKLTNVINQQILSLLQTLPMREWHSVAYIFYSFAQICLGSLAF